jgi:hypothetical protein
LSAVSQFFGAINALKLNWITIAADIRLAAAGLSTLLSMGGFLIGWHTGGVLREEQRTRHVGRLLTIAVLAMTLSYLIYWVLNATYTADDPNRSVDILVRFGFLLFYALPFCFLSYATGLLSGVVGDREQHEVPH